MSFLPSGTITSLNSGLPSREICVHGPDSDFASLAGSIIFTLRRLAALQIPSTDVALITSVGFDPSLVKSLIGTWITIEWILTPFVLSTPALSRRRRLALPALQAYWARVPGVGRERQGDRQVIRAVLLDAQTSTLPSRLNW